MTDDITASCGGQLPWTPLDDRAVLAALADAAREVRLGEEKASRPGGSARAAASSRARAAEQSRRLAEKAFDRRSSVHPGSIFAEAPDEPNQPDERKTQDSNTLN